MKLERFDMLIPDYIKKTLYEMAEKKAMKPRALGRLLLVERLNEGEKFKIRKFAEISKYNFDGLCSNEYCSEKYTHVLYTRIYEMPVIIPLCEKHAIELEDEYCKI